MRTIAIASLTLNLTLSLSLSLSLAPAPALAQAAAAPSAAAPSSVGGALLPEGFGGVTLGMSQADLRRARPAAQEGGFQGDNTGHPKLLFERHPSDYIEQVIYLFDQAKPELSGLVFVKPAQPAARAAAGFRAAVVKKWGQPDSAALARGEGGERQVALLWRRGEAVIVASYPADGSGATTVRIGRRGSDTDAHAAKLEAMAPAASQKLMQELRTQQDKAPAGAMFR